MTSGEKQEHDIEKVEISEDLDQKIEGKNTKKQSKKTVPLYIVIIIAGLLMAGLAFTTCSVVFFANRSNSDLTSNDGVTVVRQYGFGGTRMAPRRVVINSTTTTSSDTTDVSIVSGVVTSVSGNSFVIGGYGEATTIKTTDSTEYNTTGKKVAVNDTVMVTGTVSDKIITAKNISILNNSY